MPYEFREDVDTWSIPVVEMPEVSQPPTAQQPQLRVWMTEAGIFISVVLVFVVATVAVLSRSQMRVDMPQVELVASLPEPQFKPKAASAAPAVTEVPPMLLPKPPASTDHTPTSPKAETTTIPLKEVPGEEVKSDLGAPGKHRIQTWLEPREPFIGEDYFVVAGLTNFSNDPITFAATVTSVPIGDVLRSSALQRVVVPPGQSYSVRFKVKCGMAGHVYQDEKSSRPRRAVDGSPVAVVRTVAARLRPDD